MMYRRSLIIFFLFTICSTFLFGKTPGYVVLYKKSTISVKSQTLHTRTKLLLQINNREGESAASFEFPYSPANKLKALTGWIQETNGNIIRKLEKKHITTKSLLQDALFYSDYAIKKFDLKHNQYPYQIHLDYEYETSDFLTIADWSPIYDTEAQTLLATLTLEIPEEYPVRIFQRRVETPLPDTIDGKLRYSWSADYLQLIGSEPYGPPASDIYPTVTVVPLYFEYGVVGSFESWASFGDYLERLMKGQDDLPAIEAIRMVKLTENIPDTLEKIRMVYRYLQTNTRYINVAMDIGGMKPYPASYVAQNKYGDCKALTLFMKSLLSSIGIKSYYTLVTGAIKASGTITDFPSQQFNHAILCLPYHSDTLWIDCTNSVIPVGQTSVFIQGRHALVVCSEKSRLVYIPTLKPAEVAVNSTFHVSGLPHEDLNVQVQVSYTGADFERIARYVGSASEERQKELAKELLPFNNFELDDFSFIRKSPDSGTVIYNASCKVKDLIQTLDDKKIISLPPLIFPKLDKPAERDYPLSFPLPINATDTFYISIPAGLKIKTFPQAELTCSSGTYQVVSKPEGIHLVYIRKLLIQSGVTPSEQYPEFFNWIGSINAFERRNTIIINPADE